MVLGHETPRPAPTSLGGAALSDRDRHGGQDSKMG